MSTTNLDQLIRDIQDKDHVTRAAARDAAGAVGAQAVRPLGDIAAMHDDFEVARAADRAIRNIVYHCGRPGAESEAHEVTGELLGLLDQSYPVQLRRDVLSLIWQIAGEQAANRVAACLDDPDVAEDARMALERIPGKQATAALQKAFDRADQDDLPALAYSLGMRGVEIRGVPDLRLQGVKESAFQPVKG